jgi:hypothetical protein
VTIAEALELTALVARMQPHRFGRFAARWLCLWLEEHQQATLEDVTQLVSNLRSLASSDDHGSALAILRKAAPARELDRVADRARAAALGVGPRQVCRQAARRARRRLANVCDRARDGSAAATARAAWTAETL